jgi:hypothetical protein
MIRMLLAKLSARLHTIDALDARSVAHAAQLTAVLSRLDALGEAIQAVHQQDTEAQRRFEATQAALGQLDARFGTLSARLDDLERLHGAVQAIPERHAVQLAAETTVVRQGLDTLFQAELDSRAGAISRLTQLTQKLESASESLGRIETRQTATIPVDQWDQMGFAVTSQFGEDGFLQHLVRQIPISDKSFIEFGVEDYKQSNTRFLLQNNRWRGLILEGDSNCIDTIQQDSLYWWRDLTAISAFVTTENVNKLFESQNFIGDIGLLSIDIDGNDYWIWDAVTVVQPRIVSVEYNYRFGPTLSAAVPYDPAFYKRDAHPSRIYYGSSLRALAGLADEKGYDLVGCSDGGVNAFFVRRDVRPESLPRRGVAEAFRVGQHAEVYAPERSAHPLGVVKAPFDEQHALLRSLPLAHFPQRDDSLL